MLIKKSELKKEEETKEIKTSSTFANTKNEFQTSESHLGQKKSIELINSINFIEQTMTTLSSCRKRLKTQSDLNLTQKDR